MGRKYTMAVRYMWPRQGVNPIPFPSIQLPQAFILPSAVRQTISINPMVHVVLPIISSSNFQSIPSPCRPTPVMQLSSRSSICA
ncbi:hypothetical protein BC827DRAFT_1161838 [Russula dissimulans]|nr:hypothetical protein BC827DRAFT_1161838 [Russula dissimulans]